PSIEHASPLQWGHLFFGVGVLSPTDKCRRINLWSPTRVRSTRISSPVPHLEGDIEPAEGLNERLRASRSFQYRQALLKAAQGPPTRPQGRCSARSTGDTHA